MLLDRLIIKNGDTIIRVIQFKSGLNLITSEGNSVGKTTLLRSIDYCFGSNGEDFYKDNEFKNNENSIVFNFLKDNKTLFQLYFSINGKEYQISRKFNTTEGLKINTTNYSDIENYKKDLNKIIFGIDDNKPYFRNMISKFIRKDITKMKNMVKTLHFNASSNDYMLLFFNLFHFKDPNLIYQKSELLNEKKKLSKRLSVIKNGVNKNSLKQKIKLFEEDIKNIENRIRKLDLVKASDYSLEELKEVQKNIYLCNTEKGKLNFKVSLNKESLYLLEEQKSNIKVDYIEKIYKNAKISVGNLQKSLEETISFHNKMVHNKISFIEKQILELETKIKSVNKELRLFEKREGEILRMIGDKDKFGNLYVIQQELSEKAQKKGAEQKLLDLINGIEEEQKDNKQGIIDIDKKIGLYTSEFDNNVFIFNKYFSKYSKELYDQEYLISFSDDYTKIIPENIDFNVGGGAKKAYIGLFDLAYISYLNEKASTYPRFILHDSIEDTHTSSLLKLFKIAKPINGQYIISLLQDKINSIGEDKIKNDIILSLNEHNKFFKIENSN